MSSTYKRINSCQEAQAILSISASTPKPHRVLFADLWRRRRSRSWELGLGRTRLCLQRAAHWCFLIWSQAATRAALVVGRLVIAWRWMGWLISRGDESGHSSRGLRILAGCGWMKGEEENVEPTKKLQIVMALIDFVVWELQIVLSSSIRFSREAPTSIFSILWEPAQAQRQVCLHSYMGCAINLSLNEPKHSGKSAFSAKWFVPSIFP